jgi:hypothetical protein
MDDATPQEHVIPTALAESHHGTGHVCPTMSHDVGSLYERLCRAAQLYFRFLRVLIEAPGQQEEIYPLF